MSFDVQSCDVWSFDIQSFDVGSFDVQSFGVRSFDVQSSDVQSFDVQSFDVQSFDVQKVNLIPCQLGQHHVRLHATESMQSESTESIGNDDIFVNIGAFCFHSVDVESHSVLTQTICSLLTVDSVDRKYQVESTQCAEDKISHRSHT
jgi:hypothetical protein